MNLIKRLRNYMPDGPDGSVHTEAAERIAELEALRDRLTGEIEGEMKLLGRIAELEARLDAMKDAVLTYVPECVIRDLELEQR